MEPKNALEYIVLLLTIGHSASLFKTYLPEVVISIDSKLSIWEQKIKNAFLICQNHASTFNFIKHYDPRAILHER